MEKKRMELLLFALMLAGGLLFAYYKYVFSAQLLETKTVKKELAKSAAVLDELKNIEKNKQKTIDNIASMQNQIQSLEVSIPQKGNVAQFGLDLYREIKARGLVIQNLTPQNTVVQSSIKGDGKSPTITYKSKDIAINISGKRQNVLSLIDYLQKSPRKLMIREAMIKVKSVEELDANLKLQVFFVEES